MFDHALKGHRRLWQRRSGLHLVIMYPLSKKNLKIAVGECKLSKLCGLVW